MIYNVLQINKRMYKHTHTRKFSSKNGFMYHKIFLSLPKVYLVRKTDYFYII